MNQHTNIQDCNNIHNLIHDLKGHGLKGLHNLGNTCYINTFIQCLGHCLCFLIFMLKSDHKQPHPGMFQELRELYKHQWVSGSNPDPRKLLKAISNKLTLLDDIYQQNDINEFMDYFLDKLNSEICIIRQDSHMQLCSSIKGSMYHLQAQKMMHDWHVKTRKEHSELIELMYGQSINQIVCGYCRKIHHNYEVYSHIMLPVPFDDQDVSLYDCLKKYLEDEIINADTDTSKNDPWKCDRCNMSSKSTKSFVLWKTPQLLVISLKRFNSDMRKINKQVKIPHCLDVSDVVLSHECPRRYLLRSVALHFGSFLGGHYVAACRNPNDEWYIFDDDIVRKLDEPDNIISQGYVFFYEAQPEGIAGKELSMS